MYHDHTIMTGIKKALSAKQGSLHNLFEFNKYQDITSQAFKALI